MSEFRPDPGRAASFGKGGGGVLELIPGRCFFSWMTRERREEREKEGKKERVNTEKDKKKEKEIRRKYTPHTLGIYTRKLIFLENRKTIS